MKRRKPRQISRKQASDNRILAKIKAGMSPICVICGGQGCDLMHILSRARFPQYCTKEWNLVIGCREHHNLFDNNIYFRKEQKHLYDRVINNVREEDKGLVMKSFDLI